MKNTNKMYDEKLIKSLIEVRDSLIALDEEMLKFQLSLIGYEGKVSREEIRRIGLE